VSSISFLRASTLSCDADALLTVTGEGVGVGEVLGQTRQHRRSALSGFAEGRDLLGKLALNILQNECAHSLDLLI
jgi:hypothetical protein